MHCTNSRTIAGCIVEPLSICQTCWESWPGSLNCWFLDSLPTFTSEFKRVRELESNPFFDHHDWYDWLASLLILLHYCINQLGPTCYYTILYYQPSSLIIHWSSLGPIASMHYMIQSVYQSFEVSASINAPYCKHAIGLESTALESTALDHHSSPYLSAVIYCFILIIVNRPLNTCISLSLINNRTNIIIQFSRNYSPHPPLH